jgi:hypothetical protein
MAVTRISNLVVVPSVFTENMILEALELNALVSSGVMIRDPNLDAFLSSDVGGKTINPRYIGPLAQDDANVSSDDPDVNSTPAALTALSNTAVRQSLNKSWSEMDLAVDLNGMDPIAGIQTRLARYWDGELQKRALASLQGVLADNVANDGGDMVNDITGESGAAGLFNAEAFIDTQLTMGDRLGELSAIAVHSLVYGTMLKLDLIDFLPDSQGRPVASYRGLRIIVDDGVTVIDGDTSGTYKYYTYLFGPGSIALGVGQPKTPYEVDRAPAAGNGGGQETVYSRTEWVIHPQGFKTAETTTPTLANLKLAAKWDRAWERKRIQIAALISNG